MMDPSHSGDAAGEGGVCDVAIDNKLTEDFAMDTGGDNNHGNKGESDLLNGDRDETEIAMDVKNSDADNEDDGYAIAGFAPLTALNSDENDKKEDDDDDNVMEDDSVYAQIESANEDNEAGEVDSVEEDVNEQAPDAKVDDAMDSHVEADVDAEVTGHDDTGASFVTAGDRTLPDNAGGGDMDETIENAGDDRSQDESEDGLFHDAESSITNDNEEADRNDDQGNENSTEETADDVEHSNDVDEQSRDSLGESGQPPIEPEQDSQDSVRISEPEPEQESQDSVAISEDIEPQEQEESQDSFIQEIQPDDSVDNFDENADSTGAPQQEDTEKDSEDVHVPETEPISPDVEENIQENIEGTSDTQDSAGKVSDVVDLDGEVSSSPKGIADNENEANLVDTGDTQDSVSRDADVVDLDDELEANDTQDSVNKGPEIVDLEGEGQSSPKEVVQDIVDAVDTQDSINESTDLTKDEGQIETSDSVIESHDQANAENDSVTEVSVAKIDDNLIEADNNENTSEPIITGVMSLEGIDFDNSNDGQTEQMETDDVAGKDSQIEPQDKTEQKPSETTTMDKDASDNVEESMKEYSAMTEADEDKLLEDTEQKKGEGEEAMETDVQGQEAQQDADKEAISEKSLEEGEKSVDDTAMAVDQSEETAEKIREKSPAETESTEKTAEERQKSEADVGKSVVDNSQEAGDSADKSATEIEKSTVEGVASDKDAMKSDGVDEKKVKQEKIEEDGLKAEGGGEDSAGPKIVGVTSGAGEADVKPAPVKRKRSSSEKKKGGSRTASPVVIDDDDDKADTKAKEETPGRTTRSATVKKDQEDKPKPVKKEAADKDDDVIAIKEEKKPAPPKPKSSKIQKCIVCLKTGKCKYNIVRNGDVKHLCDDVCFKKFRSNPTEYLRTVPAAKADAKSNAAPTPSPNQKAAQKQAPGAPPPVYKTCTVCQLMNVRTSKPFLNWQGLDFCGEECLGKFQGSMSATCSYCASQISQVNRAKFCWRVGTEVKQFCTSLCYNEFIKRLKLCAFCNKDLANIRDSFMAPVGNQGTFKDFCSQGCLAKYEEKNAKDLQIVGAEKGQKTGVPPKGNFQCQVCGKTGPVKHEIKLEGKQNRLCSDPCLSAFQYANKLTMNTCDNCGTNCYNENSSPQYIQFEGQQKRFCSFMCVNTFKNFNMKTVPCAWCGAKKGNFDMIERVDANNKYQLFCSLNCLSLYRVNLQATSNQAVTCDQCRKYVPAQYHLTMSDASVRNFCSYTCVMQFQQQFTAPKQPQQQTTNQARQQATPQGQAGLTTRSKATYNTRGTGQQPKQTTPPPTKQSARQIALAQKKQASNNASIPIISNVVSLAPGEQQKINVKSSAPVVVQGQPDAIKTTTTTAAGAQTVQQQIIIQPPPPKTVKNKSLLCKPYVQTKATSCKPHTQTKEAQTEGKPEPDRYFIPLPIPIYVPTPLAMYSTPTPVMVPVPIPVPVPVFIPTTKKSSGSILKQIKEIREKIPNDPLEAELLMMAEALGGEDKESSSESEDELPAALPPTPSTKQEVAPAQELGEDMLQMALRMASEMTDEPVMDLENSLEPVAVNTVPPTPPAPKPRQASPPAKEEEYDTDEYIPPSARTRRSGGRKRQSSSRRGRAKRPKIEPQPEIIPQREATPSPQPQAPPPDANFHLKYTYGVNAWKHWVIAKNSQMEAASKSSKKLKLFKTDILQCTADELNYALCLFVKEVRKPNGEEYAVDSIYYLCLGIQQYLFENGRIDNIFTDNYFEKFTEFLNEVLTMYEPKLNTAGQLVCRIEEEHLWESKQLGAHSPHVLLNSLVYFNTKYFMLKTSEDHLKLSFTHIMKHWKKTASGKGSGTGANLGRSVYLRYYCPNLQGKSDPNQKKRKEEMPVYEQTENLENPLRCPVKLYEFYLSKCPESIKNRNDTFYLVPERSCVPDSPVWYSTMTLGVDHMAKMLNRIRLVREIQEAHLHTQPVYI